MPPRRQLDLTSLRQSVEALNDTQLPFPGRFPAGSTYPSSHASVGNANNVASVEGELERRPARSLLSVGGEETAQFQPLVGAIFHGARR